MADDFGGGKGAGGGGGFSFGGSFGPSTISSAAGAVSDLFAGFGDAYKAKGAAIEAGMYGEAATFADQNAAYTDAATRIKVAQQQRELGLTQSSAQASVAGAGFAASGSALDILRDSATQGALAKGVLTQQGFITEQGYKEQADALRAQQQAAQVSEQAAKSAETGSFITGALKGVAAVASVAAAPFTGGASLAALPAIAAVP